MKTATGIDPLGMTKEMYAEFDAFVEYVVFQQNGTFADLLTKKVMFPSTARLAQLLNTAQSAAAVTAPAERGGILFRPLVLNVGKASSAPIPRGVLLRRELLCTNLPSPDSTIVNSRLNSIEDFPATTYTAREITAHITNSQACMGCHAQINPLGFAFETFGPFGDLRTKEKVFDLNGNVIAEHAINTVVDNIPIPGRTPASVTTAGQLAQELAITPSVMRCFSQQVYRFTRVRNAVDSDGCGMNQMVEGLIKGGTIKESLVNNVANDEIFWRAVAK
jgi:hypothetical protein